MSRVLSICTGMGLLDRAFLDAGFEIVPGCEIDAQKRAMYEALTGHANTTAGRLGHDPYVCHDLRHLVDGEKWISSVDGIIGGPSCQSHSKLRAMRTPKFPDLTPLVLGLLAGVKHDWFCFENVVPIAIPGAVHTRCNAMHFYQPHQSRVRWFTHSPNIKPPTPVFKGSVDDLMAYPVVAGRIYGPKRGAKLQGFPPIAGLPFPCVQLQHGLADAVPYPLGLAWANAIKASV